MPTLPSVSSAGTGSGVAAGTVPSRGAASPVEDRFCWVIGIQFGILIAVIGGLVGVVTKLL